MSPLSRLASPGLITALALLAGTLQSAETYSGRIKLSGELQNSAKPGSISLTYTGQLSNGNTGEKANVSGGGLFRSTSDAISPATFTGKLTSYTRLSASVGSTGRLIKRVKNVRVTTSRRFVRFPGGSVTLDRAINSKRIEKQRVSGRGTLRTSV